jgi:hypothetical protein
MLRIVIMNVKTLLETLCDDVICIQYDGAEQWRHEKNEETWDSIGVHAWNPKVRHRLGARNHHSPVDGARDMVAQGDMAYFPTLTEVCWPMIQDRERPIGNKCA